MWLNIILAVMALLALVIVFLLIKVRQTRRDLTVLQHSYDLLSENIRHQANDIAMLSQQTQGVVKSAKSQQGEIQQQQSQLQQIQELAKLYQQQAQELQNKVQNLESQNQENKLYTRAKKLIELGADIEELIAECGLSRSEAELLLSIHRTAE